MCSLAGALVLAFVLGAVLARHRTPSSDPGGWQEVVPPSRQSGFDGL